MQSLERTIEQDENSGVAEKPVFFGRIGRYVRGIVFGSVIGLAMAGGARGATPGLYGVGDLEGSFFHSAAYDVSADGSVVVGSSKSGSGWEAFRWTKAEGMQGLGDLPGKSYYSTGRAVSSDGSVVVGKSSSTLGEEPYRWENNVMKGLGYLPGGTSFGGADGVSADGSVVVGWSKSQGFFVTQAFRWENDVMVGLGDLPGGKFFSSATAVSADGSVVVGYSISTLGYEAFRWENGEMVGLGGLPDGSGGSDSVAWDVSADGSVVVGDSISEAFRWENDVMTGLGDLPGGGFDSRAYAVSADGSVVVGRSQSASGEEAFIWTETRGMLSIKDLLENDYSLDLTGWTLSTARGVSADGSTIVGYGVNPDGLNEGWVAVIPQPMRYPIDIKPQACPNPLSIRSKGMLPVAILGTEELDVNDIDAVSIRLNDVAPIRHSYEDVTTPVLDVNDCNCTTEGADGFTDLTLKFKTQDIVDTLPDVNDGDVLELPLTGLLTDGTPIEGSDCITIRGKHKPLNKADFNGDGTVDMADFATFTENWLQSSIVEY